MNLRPLLLSAILISFSCTISQAQTSDEVHYYKDKWGSKETTADHAKYSKRIRQGSDGTTTTEWRYVPNDKVIQSESYRDGMPVGVWMHADNNGNISSQRDYRFELRYTNDSCTSGYRYRFGSDTLAQRAAGVFAAPTPKGYKNGTEMLLKNLRYPDQSREAGIEGRVVLTMKLNEDGKLTDIMVLERADVLLNVEAARIFFSNQEWTPATLNGKPIPLCITCPITFKLD